jgi:hypothetical protein
VLFPELLERVERLAAARRHLGGYFWSYVSIVESAPFNSTEGYVIVAAPGAPFQVGMSERGAFRPWAEVATEEEACHSMWRKISVGYAHPRVVPIDPEVLRLGMRRWSKYRARFLAADPAASPRRLARLSTYRDVAVRRGVADHASTPPAILGRLAADGEFMVRWTVARNPRTPSDALTALVGDPEVAVGVALAANASCPSHALSSLASSTEPDVRRELARNPHTPVADLERLAADPEDSVALWVGANPSASAAAQLILAANTSEHVRSFARLPE